MFLIIVIMKTMKVTETFSLFPNAESAVVEGLPHLPLYTIVEKMSWILQIYLSKKKGAKRRLRIEHVTLSTLGLGMKI